MLCHGVCSVLCQRPVECCVMGSVVCCVMGSVVLCIRREECHGACSVMHEKERVSWHL